MNGAGEGSEGELKESGMKANFLRFAFQTRYVSGDVGYPGGQVLSRQQKQGTRRWRSAMVRINTHLSEGKC